MMALLHVTQNLGRSTVWLLYCAVLIAAWPGPVYAAENDNENSSTSSTGELPIVFFTNTLSKADGDRCPMYPSCSHYASQAVKRHGIIKGWMLAFDRLLRCGRDELRLSPKIQTRRGVRTLDPVEANTRWWRQP
jgi:putative component of membrane protein insertase Oxa1/YidC/SpoIIIJ protein YidD